MSKKENLRDLYQQSINLRLKGQQKEALAILEGMIANSLGQQYDLVREKANCLYEMDQPLEAIAQYKLSIDLYPPVSELSVTQKLDLSNTYVGQARSYSDLNNQEEALQLLRKAKEIHPENKDRINIEKGIIFYKQERIEEAQDLLLSITQSQNLKIKQEAYFRLGYITEDPKQQLEFYRRADQEDPIVLFNLANCYVRLGQLSAAQEKYIFAIQAKKDAKYVFNLAKCFERNGQYEEAIETYMKALSLEKYKQIYAILQNLSIAAGGTSLPDAPEDVSSNLVQAEPEYKPFKFYLTFLKNV